MHRDLSPHTAGKRVEIRLTDDDLVISNPGGLRGITVRNLGGVIGKSAVNQYLYEIAKFTRIRDGARIIEGEGGGIREVQSALAAAGMSPPVFHDTGVAFVARLPRHALMGRSDLEWLAEMTAGIPLSDVQRELLVRLRHGEVLTNKAVRDSHGIADPSAATRTLQGLVSTGLVSRTGRGGGTNYRFSGQMPDVGGLVHVDVEVPRIVDDHTRRSPTKHGPRVLDALSMPRRFDDIVERTGLSVGQVRYALRHLQSDGSVRMVGAQGRRDTTYEALNPPPDAAST